MMTMFVFTCVFVALLAGYAGRKFDSWWPTVRKARGWISLEVFIASVAAMLGFAIGQIFPYRPDFNDAAAWVQAVGSIAAIGIVVWADRVSNTRRKIERAEMQAEQVGNLMTVYASALAGMDRALELVRANAGLSLHPDTISVFVDRLEKFGVSDLPSGEAQLTVGPVRGSLRQFIEDMEQWASGLHTGQSVAMERSQGQLSGRMGFHRSMVEDALIRVARQRLAIAGKTLTVDSVCRVFDTYGINRPDPHHPLFDFRLNGMSASDLG